MKQSIFEIISNKNIAENVFEMVLLGVPDIKGKEGF